MKIPCEDCVVLPMCIAKTRDKFTLYTYLKRTCTIFEKHSYDFHNIEMLKQVFKIFGVWNPKKRRREPIRK